MSTYQWYLTEKRTQLFDFITNLQEYKHYDKAEILEEALQSIKERSFNPDKTDPTLFSNPYTISDYLKSIRHDKELWNNTAEKIQAWKSELERISHME